jgi:hypothetical protein
MIFSKFTNEKVVSVHAFRYTHRARVTLEAMIETPAR